MHYKPLTAAVFAAAALLTVAGCSSNQSLKTTDGRTIVTDGKPQVDDDTGLVSYKMRKPVVPSRSIAIRLNRWMNWITKRYLWPREE